MKKTLMVLILLSFMVAPSYAGNEGPVPGPAGNPNYEAWTQEDRNRQEWQLERQRDQMEQHREWMEQNERDHHDNDNEE